MLNKFIYLVFYAMPSGQNNLAILFTHIYVKDKTLELLGKRRISDNWNFRNV